MKTLIGDCQLLIIYINHQSLIINTIHIIVINAVPKCHRLMTDHKMSSLIRPQNVIINPTPICRRSLTDGILGSAIVACGNIGSTTLKAQGQIIHQGRRPCFATRRWPIPKMEIVQRFSFLVSDKKEKLCNDFSCDVECIK